jgi:hypothetical protein
MWGVRYGVGDVGWEIWGHVTPMSEVELLLHLRQLAEDRQRVEGGALRVGLRRATEADERGQRDLRDEGRVDVGGVADGGETHRRHRVGLVALRHRHRREHLQRGWWRR